MCCLNVQRLCAITTYLCLFGSTLSLVPSSSPTLASSSIPSTSSLPSYQPSLLPSVQISNLPTHFPSKVTQSPSSIPTITSIPSSAPSVVISANPSISSTNDPSVSPTLSRKPTISPSTYSSMPSFSPSVYPSDAMTLLPSLEPTYVPSSAPTIKITKKSNSQVKIIVLSTSLIVGIIFLFTIWFIFVRGKCVRHTEEEQGNIEFIVEPSVSFNDDNDNVSEEVYDKSETDDNDEGLSYAGFSLATEDTNNRPVGLVTQGRDLGQKKDDDLVRTWIGTGKLSNTEILRVIDISNQESNSDENDDSDSASFSA